jgi:hypothetical protein
VIELPVETPVTEMTGVRRKTDELFSQVTALERTTIAPRLMLQRIKTMWRTFCVVNHQGFTGEMVWEWRAKISEQCV